MNATRNIKKAYYILSHHGFTELLRRARIKLTRGSYEDKTYKHFIMLNEPNADALMLQERTTFTHMPLISFVCPTYNTKKKFFRDLVQSLQRQTYAKWELCIADGGSNPSTVDFIRKLAKDEPRLKTTYLPVNLGIAKNTAVAVDASTGQYLAFVDHDDILAPFACFELVKAINAHPQADFFYSDEDKIDTSGRFAPHFKPSWSPDTLKSYNYITHLMVLSRSLYRRCGGLREGYDGSQDHDLALRAGIYARQVVHIDKVLYHWRAHSGSVAGDGMCKNYAFEAGRKAVQSAMGYEGRAEHGSFHASYRARYQVQPQTVSIIIPNRDKVELLEECVQSILKTADMPYEIIIVENGSVNRGTFLYYSILSNLPNVQVLRYDKPFNYSAINNYGARMSTGELLLFMNNDVVAKEEGWLCAMAEHACRKNVGAVGAKLLFADDTVQHAGVVVGMGGWADHICAGVREDGGGIYGANHIINSIRNVSAVTGACLLCDREKFEAVGGFDERFILCGSDVALCLRFLEQGFVNIYTPFARLYHYESATRANMDIPAVDFAYSLQAYRQFLEHGDPYYSLNLDYTSKRPQVAQNIAPPSALNPMYTK